MNEEEFKEKALKIRADSRYRELVIRAGIPELWRDVTFATSDPKVNTDAFEIARRYAENFTTDSKSLVFYSGGYGCGKTHLAICIANYVLHKLKRPVLFKKARDLLLEIRRTFAVRANLTEADIIDRVLSVDLLVLDDVGVGVPSPWLESTYWTVLDRRLEDELPLIVTTNYTLETGYGEVSLGDRIGYGALSRLVKLCDGIIIDLSGPDLR
jgi:DNA replication protein DnaC